MENDTPEVGRALSVLKSMRLGYGDDHPICSELDEAIGLLEGHGPAADAEAERVALELEQAECAKLKAKNPPAMHPVIDRFGSKVFQFTVITGGVGGAISTLASCLDEALKIISGAPSKAPLAVSIQQRAGPAIQIAITATNEMAYRWVQAEGWDQTVLQECRQDVQRASLLAQRPSGLILPH